MANEKDLAEQFDRILEDIRTKCIYHKPRWEVYNDNYKQGVIEELRGKISELETLSIENIKLEESIRRILQKVEEDVRKILLNTQLSKTEAQIRRFIEGLKGPLRMKLDKNIPIYVEGGIGYLKALQVSEEDLVKARKRVTQILDRLVKEAERLE